MKPLNAASAAKAEALRIAHNQVRLRLRAQGVKLSYIEASEITRLARALLQQHRAELNQNRSSPGSAGEAAKV